MINNEQQAGIATVIGEILAIISFFLFIGLMLIFGTAMIAYEPSMYSEAVYQEQR